MATDDPRSTIVFSGKSTAMDHLKEAVKEKNRHLSKADFREFWQQNFEDEVAEHFAEFCFMFFDELTKQFPDGDFHRTYRGENEATAGFDSSYIPFFYDHQTQLEVGFKELENGNFDVSVGFTERWLGQPAELNEEQAAFRAARRQEMAEGLTTYLAWRCQKDGHSVVKQQRTSLTRGDETEKLALDRFAGAYEAWQGYSIDPSGPDRSGFR